MPSSRESAATQESTTTTTSESTRSVRFNNDCVLIPEPLPVKRPLLVTRSYSLWKKRSPSASPISPNASVSSLPLKESRVMVRLPCPAFMTRRRAASYGRIPDSPSLQRPLAPCLVHRSASLPSMEPKTISRRPSLPQIGEKRALPTVPLRACCPECHPVTERAQRAGDSWVEKFTHREGARCPSDSCLCIIVDEVDKRRSVEEDEDEDQLFPLPSPRRSPSSTSSDPPSPMSPVSPPSLLSCQTPWVAGEDEGPIPPSLSRSDRCVKGFLCPESGTPSKK